MPFDSAGYLKGANEILAKQETETEKATKEDIYTFTKIIRDGEICGELGERICKLLHKEFLQ